jgi:hypothetical protein
MQEGVTKAKTLNMVFNKFLKVPSSPRVKVLNQPHFMATPLLQDLGRKKNKNDNTSSI